MQVKISACGGSHVSHTSCFLNPVAFEDDDADRPNQRRSASSHEPSRHISSHGEHKTGRKKSVGHGKQCEVDGRRSGRRLRASIMSDE